MHGAFLLAALGDFPVSIDAGYHVALGRWYGEHGSAFWDHINYGPGGRPNLQGPALHLAIGALGRLLGGSGDAYVLANAVLAVVQWAAAMFTAAWFGRRYGGDAAALLAVALLAGNALAAGSFAVGIPSGWIFILAPWAIHFFMEGRLALATLATTGAIYSHLGGYATVPAGLVVATLLTGRWRALVVVGAATVALTAPYTIHFLRHLAWYRGAHGHVAVALAPLIYLTALPGLIALGRRPRQHAFLLAWIASPAVWIVQDYTRFLAQATLPMAAIGGIWAAGMVARLAGPARTAATAALVALATLPSPLNDSSLRREAAWVFGTRYPRSIDWAEARVLGGVLERQGLTSRLVSAYNPTQCLRLAVYAPVQFEKGHWVEVQPAHDPAEDLSAADKVYVLPMAPEDPVLAGLERQGLLTVHGGSAATSVVSLKPAPPPDAVAHVVGPILAEEASWIAANARNNVPRPRSIPLDEWRAALRAQRAHAGRLQIAIVLQAYALEATAPEVARPLRGAGRGFGSLANFLGDDACIDFVAEAHHARMRENMAAVAAAAAGLATGPEGVPPLRAAFRKLFGDYFTAA